MLQLFINSIFPISIFISCVNLLGMSNQRFYFNSIFVRRLLHTLLHTSNNVVTFLQRLTNPPYKRRHFVDFISNRILSDLNWMRFFHFFQWYPLFNKMFGSVPVRIATRSCTPLVVLCNLLLPLRS